MLEVNRTGVKFLGLIVLISTTTLSSGQGHNLTGLFNIVTVTDRNTLGNAPIRIVGDMDYWRGWFRNWPFASTSSYSY